MDLRKLLRRSGKLARSETQFDSTVRSTDHSTIEREIEELVWSQLERALISPAVVSVEVKLSTSSGEAKPVYAAMLRIVAWEKKSVVRLLLCAPLLDAKVRRLFQTSWLADVSAFGGIWLHSSHQIHAGHNMRQLRNLLLQIEGATESGSSDELWTLPPRAPGPDLTIAK